MIDLHNHVIPGVDDGAADEAASRAALRAFAEDGVRQVVATPHLLGSLTLEPPALAKRLAELDAAWARLRAIAGEMPGMKVARGAEVMLDVPEPDFRDERVRLAGGRTVLVEFPFMTIPPQAARAVSAIPARGFTPLLAHAERYGGVTPEAVEEWRRAGAIIQVNGPSLLGKYGDGPRRAACSLLERGLVDLVASDYHTRGRPLVAEYRALLVEQGSAEQATLLTATNPARAVAGEMLIPVGSIRVRRGPWTRMLSAFRRSSRRGGRG